MRRVIYTLVIESVVLSTMSIRDTISNCVSSEHVCAQCTRLDNEQLGTSLMCIVKAEPLL